jgi:type II secretory pathway pseudopilin PulG
LPELLVVVLLVGVVAAGMGSVFASQNRTYVQQDLHVAMEENLRLAMSAVTDSLRAAGCGVPPSDLSNWITWVAGFVEDPLVVTDGGAGPDTLSLAVCTPPLAELTAAAAAGSTSLVVSSSVSGKLAADLLNTTDKGLIWIGDGDHARIRAASGGALTIDTDPTTAGNQGLLRSYPPGAPISRIDVLTFSIQTDVTVNLPVLHLDRQRGTVESVADGISDLQVTTTAPGRQYRIALTGRSEKEDPVTGALLTRSLVSDITLRN